MSDVEQLRLLPGEAAEPDEIKVTGGVSLKDILDRAVPAFIAPGVYFLLLNGDVVYVGQSTNIVSRICQHLTQRLIDFDSYAWVLVDRQDLLVTEAAYIVKFKPKYNAQMLKDMRWQRIGQNTQITGNQPEYQQPPADDGVSEAFKRMD